MRDGSPLPAKLEERAWFLKRDKVCRADEMSGVAFLESIRCRTVLFYGDRSLMDQWQALVCYLHGKTKTECAEPPQTWQPLLPCDIMRGWVYLTPRFLSGRAQLRDCVGPLCGEANGLLSAG